MKISKKSGMIKKSIRNFEGSIGGIFLETFRAKGVMRFPIENVYFEVENKTDFGSNSRLMIASFTSC